MGCLYTMNTRSLQSTTSATNSPAMDTIRRTALQPRWTIFNETELHPRSLSRRPTTRTELASFLLVA